MAKKMGSSLSFNNRIRIVLAGVIFLQPFSTALSAELPRPFPVLGSVSVHEGRWDDTPALLDKLADKVLEDSVRFQITASAAEQYFSLGLLEDSRRGFQKLLKAEKTLSLAYLFSKRRPCGWPRFPCSKGSRTMPSGRSIPCSRTGTLMSRRRRMLLKARTFLVQRSWSDLNLTLRELVQQNPAYANDLSINLLRGVAALEQDHPDEALLFVKRYPDEPSALYYQSVCYIKKKEISNALPLYQQILQKDPHSEWVDRMRMALGEAFYPAHDIPLAQEFFKPVTRPQADPGAAAAGAASSGLPLF